MMQSNLAPKYTPSPRHNHKRSQSPGFGLTGIKLDQRRHLRGAQTQLVLNRIEKRVLMVGIVIILGLTFALITTKITDGVYQRQAVTMSTNISKFHNLNNNSRQQVSDLQRTSRLQKVAHHNHLKFSGHDVRNVK